jgi:hypothetical protein
MGRMTSHAIYQGKITFMFETTNQIVMLEDRIRNGQRYVLFGDAFLKFPISYLLQDDCMALITQTSEVVAETATPLWLACIAYIMNILFGDQSMVMRTTVILLKDL